MDKDRYGETEGSHITDEPVCGQTMNGPAIIVAATGTNTARMNRHQTWITGN